MADYVIWSIGLLIASVVCFFIGRRALLIDPLASKDYSTFSQENFWSPKFTLYAASIGFLFFSLGVLGVGLYEDGVKRKHSVPNYKVGHKRSGK